MEDTSTSKVVTERVFFIVDRTRLKDEKDELKNAIVVYIPEKDLSKPNLEQRCSQLVGISFLVNYFTGKLPKFIRLKSNGFAIRPLGEDYVMGFQSKFDEPKWCVLQLIDRIHDFFCFYYSSPTSVWNMARQDWEIFSAQMTAIFHCILEFTLKEGRSLPSMFNPLPYVMLSPNKGGTQLYIKAQRLLRKCQQNDSVIAGCMFYEGQILCSQLPPDMAEKLMLVASGGIELNSRSILEDQLAPESVWIINVYLTDEQLELTQHLRRRTDDLRTLYSGGLKPNMNLESEIQSQQRYQNSHVIVEASSNKHNNNNKSPIVGVPKNSPKHYSALHGNDEDSFVTISYGSDSVSFTKKQYVNPLKRSKVHGKRSLGESPSLRRGIFDPLPPTPMNKSPRQRPLPSPPGAAPPNLSNPYDTLNDDMTPPIPPKTYDVMDENEETPPIPHRSHDNQTPPVPPKVFSTPESQSPPTLITNQSPPIPSRGVNPEDSLPPVPNRLRQGRGELTVPKPPPRKGDQPPVPPPRSPRASSKEETRPPSPPPRGESVKGRQDTKTSVEDIVTEYGTPKSSLDVFVRSGVSNSAEEGSDQSEGYRTPPPFSSRNQFESSDSMYSQSHSSFFTKDNAGTKQHFEDVENHYEFDDSSQVTPDANTTMRSDGSGSLIITKAVSEYGSDNQLDDTSEDTSLGTKSTPQLMFESLQSQPGLEDSIITEGPSPVPPELTEDDSVSEGDEDGTGNDRRRSFVQTLRQKDSAKLGTLAHHTHSRTKMEDPKNKMAAGLVMHKKCLYVQKCVNTVVAILADEDLPNDNDLIKNLWTTLLSWIVQLNNTVEPNLKDQDSIYYEHTQRVGGAGSTFKAYHAGFSANIAMCEVSSITAPYQFRHAVRRIHHEYAQDPTLRQVSLCKDLTFKMISQNVLGRESFYHSNKVGTSDTLLAHSCIEKQVKQQRQYYGTEGFTTDFL